MAKQFLDLTGLNHVWQQINNLFQRKLVSGTNIKTINNQSLVGSGNLDVTIDLSDYATRTWVNAQGFAKGSFLPLEGGTLTGTVYTNNQILWRNGATANVTITAGEGNGIDISGNDSYYTQIRHKLTTIYAGGSKGYVYIGNIFNLDEYEHLYGSYTIGIRITDSTGGKGATSLYYDGKDNELWNTAGGKTTIESLTEEEITAILV